MSMGTMRPRTVSVTNARLLSVFCLAASVICGSNCVNAAEDIAATYPNRQVRLVVPFAPGAAADALMRALASQLQLKWKQPVYVENFPGVGGMLGVARVARSPADGYTLTQLTSGQIILHAIMSNPPVDPLTQLAPISILAKSPLVLVTSTQSKLKTFSDLVARARKSTVDFGTAGVGSKHEVVTMELARLAGLHLQHVPYRGASEALNDLLGGHLSLQMASTSTVFPLILSGRINALAVVADKRLPMLPKIPTLAELGYPLTSPEWFALAAPAGTPNAVVEKIARSVGEVINAPKIKAVMPTEELLASTPAELAHFLKEETTVWGEAAKREGIKVE